MSALANKIAETLSSSLLCTMAALVQLLRAPVEYKFLLSFQLHQLRSDPETVLIIQVLTILSFLRHINLKSSRFL